MTAPDTFHVLDRARLFCLYSGASKKTTKEGQEIALELAALMDALTSDAETPARLTPIPTEGGYETLPIRHFNGDGTFTETASTQPATLDEIAQAWGRQAGNLHARENGRDHWDDSDYAVAAEQRRRVWKLAENTCAAQHGTPPIADGCDQCRAGVVLWIDEGWTEKERAAKVLFAAFPEIAP